MWHIMLCGLLALSAVVELEPLKNLENPVLTDQRCESCPTCAKRANSAKKEYDRDGVCAAELRDWRAYKPAMWQHERRWMARRPLRNR